MCRPFRAENKASLRRRGLRFRRNHWGWRDWRDWRGFHFRAEFAVAGVHQEEARGVHLVEFVLLNRLRIHDTAGGIGEDMVVAVPIGDEVCGHVREGSSSRRLG